MSEDHFWDRVQVMLDRRLDPLDDDEIAAVFLERPEWAAALVTMTSRVGRLTKDIEGVAPRARPLRSAASLAAAAALMLIALTLSRASRTGSPPLLEPTVVDPAVAPAALAAVFRVDSFVSRVSTVARGRVTERAEVLRDGRVVSLSTASEVISWDGSFVVRSTSQSRRPRQAPWGSSQGAPSADPFAETLRRRRDGR